VSALAVIGKATPKKDGPDKVTGRTRFLHDLVLPRMAHGKILRAQHPHARIVRIDTARAAALPGVLAVITAADVEQRDAVDCARTDHLEEHQRRSIRSLAPVAVAIPARGVLVEDRGEAVAAAAGHRAKPTAAGATTAVPGPPG